MSETWQPATFKGKRVLAAVTPQGEVSTNEGRVQIRYSPKAGATIYRAGLTGITLLDEPIQTLDAGTTADTKSPSGNRRPSSGFGSAGSRTKAQAAMAAEAALALIKSQPEGTTIGYTDGGAKGNPGPAGSGVVLELPDGRRVEASQSLGHGTNNIAELSAIGLAQDLADQADLPKDAPIVLFTDSSYTHGVLVKNWKAKANTELIMGLRERLSSRPGVTIEWVAGHVGTPGNEAADLLAGQGVLGITSLKWS
jgi:ribonuclease HI